MMDALISGSLVLRFHDDLTRDSCPVSVEEESAGRPHRRAGRRSTGAAGQRGDILRKGLGAKFERFYMHEVGEQQFA